MASLLGEIMECEYPFRASIGANTLWTAIKEDFSYNQIHGLSVFIVLKKTKKPRVMHAYFVHTRLIIMQSVQRE